MLKVLADDGYTTTTCNKDVEHHRDRARAWTTKYNVDVSKYIKDNFIRYQNDVFCGSMRILKTVAFIMGKKNQAIQKIFIRFSIENLIANISVYALSWPKLNFGCYLTFEIIFKALFQGKNE